MENDASREKTKTDIYTYLKEGMYKRDAALMAGIDESTFYRWVKEDASFASRVEANILEYKRSLIRNVTKHSETNGMLALQILKTRWPNEWGKPKGDTDIWGDGMKRLEVAVDSIVSGWRPKENINGEMNGEDKKVDLLQTSVVGEQFS